MNLLSHAYIARTRTHQLFIFGTALPDLLAMYDRALRAERLSGFLARTGAHAQLAAGIDCHARADRDFHSSDFFRASQRALRKRLEAIDGITVKRFFLAHILFEMLLDRYLIESQPEFI